MPFVLHTRQDHFLPLLAPNENIRDRVFGHLMRITSRSIILLLYIFIVAFTALLFAAYIRNHDCIHAKLRPFQLYHNEFFRTYPEVSDTPAPYFESAPLVNTSHICNNYSTIIVIHSDYRNEHFRHYIRQNLNKEWKIKHNAFVMFVVGMPESLETCHLEDVMCTNVKEHYHNISYKSQVWVRELSKCQILPNIILKLDDDVFFDRKLLEVMLTRKMPNRSIFCSVIRYGQVTRHKKSKWYLSPEDYKSPTLGTYCRGMAYLFTGDLLPTMATNIDQVQYLWMDDWYVTRALMNGTNVRYFDGTKHFVWEANEQLIGNNDVIFAHFRPPERYSFARRKELAEERFCIK